MGISDKHIRHAAGSLLVVGLSGTEVTALEQAWLKLVRPSGIILFRRNIVDAGQTRSLLAEAASFCGSASLRCVDIEGGTVDRLRDAVAPMPSAQAVARTGRLAWMKQHGELIAKEASAFGFNTTLAPVLDLALPVSANVMGTRSADATPDGVIRYVRAFLQGLSAHGVVGCAKHFPGLGGGTLDSHLETPSISRSWSELWNEDLVPYRELAPELSMVMVNHAAYPDTRGGDRPATASPFWITTVLQKRIGYRGLTFSDDMEMGGILKYLPMEEAAIAAVRAGLHMMEICHSPELILRCYESLIHEAERSIAFRKLLFERARAAARLRSARFSRPTTRALNATQLNALREKVLRFGETVKAAQPA
ncbi:beta-N-acetylhexosaminidase [Acidicapsa ligni]|uniref:beta-N-acetylhexosaminidase n=1 Tax=Acidicapsa ligni TaxID=542300 RepID=UPI0021E0CEA3|nr:beta-N-acetylhexosaminidase [Acidicapsa ligni]